MAIFHLSIKTVSRSKGRSAVAASAYRAGVCLLDRRLGQTFDYRRKKGVLYSELVLPADVPAWAVDRAQLWNEAEKSETRKNSTVAREFEIALPIELSEIERKKLALALASELAARHECGVDVAVHAAGRGGDNRNQHAHLLTTTRRLNSFGFHEKCRELDDQKSGEVIYWRNRWEELVNQALANASQTAMVDHRSLFAQGLDREPTFHFGPARTAIHRRLARLDKRAGRVEIFTPQQERAAKQLATMKARLSKSNLARFQKPETETTEIQGEKNEQDDTPIPG